MQRARFEFAGARASRTTHPALEGITRCELGTAGTNANRTTHPAVDGITRCELASTGKANEAPYLKALGAAEVVDRSTLSQPGKPMQKERWAGVVDSVGSHTLANACAQTVSEGVVTACGLAQGMDFPVTVAPFILRGVVLVGINSVTAPRERRERAWDMLSKELAPATLDSMIETISLGHAIERAPDVLAGRIRGRLVVDVNR